MFGGLRHIALTGVQFGSDREVAQLREPAADVLDVLVDSEDFLYDQYDRQAMALRRHGPVGRHAAIACGNLNLTGRDAGRVRGDRLGRYRPHRQGEARR
jgi:hypothetical protein